MKKVLVACEYSGIVRDAFSEKGWDAWSCDFLPTEKPGNHIQGDVLDVIGEKWDLIIAHPTCTYLCNSGVRWLTDNPERWEQMKQAALFFKTFLQLSGNQHVAVENPIMHKYAVEIIGCRQTQVVQPWMFGHGETKGTGLWLKYLPPLRPTNIVDGREQRLWKLPPGPDRWKERSRTFQGIADAMADQWTAFLCPQKIFVRL
jgi:hypothetical protein